MTTATKTRYPVNPVPRRSRWEGWIVPTWHESAKCSGTSQPWLWDSVWPAGHPRRSKTSAATSAAVLCLGCPVIAQCARECLERSPEGMIRAGIPVLGRQPGKRTIGALAAIAAGDDPLMVYRAMGVWV